MSPAADLPLQPGGRVHFLGICGYAVSGAALIAKELGYAVSGSDEDAYPPVTERITAAGIPWVNFHSPSNLALFGEPALVVVGNQVREGNTELVAARASGIPCLSEMEFYRQITSDRQRVAVCGTHGKSTTAALLTHILDVAGSDPGFRLGATPVDFGTTARLGSGPFVFEGDEYRTSSWDPRPKFLHIDPEVLVVTNIEYDHPDIYATREEYVSAFRTLLSQTTPSATVVMSADDPLSRELADLVPARLVSIGEDPAATWKLLGRRDVKEGQSVEIRVPSGVDISVRLPLWGEHNARNALCALAAAETLGVQVDRAAMGLEHFHGVRRRFEVLGEACGTFVVDDYAHHPTKVRATLSAARERWPWHRLVALFVPHTYSRTGALLDEYAASFGDADTVLVGPVEAARERKDEESVDSGRLVSALRERGVAATTVSSPEDALRKLSAVVGEKDVILCMTVRGFDDIARRALDMLRGRPDA